MQAVGALVGSTYGVPLAVVSQDNARLDKLILGQTDSFANGHGLSFIVLAQHTVGESDVHQPVLRLIDGTRSSVEGDSTTFLIKEGCLTDIVFLSIKGHDVTRGCYP